MLMNIGIYFKREELYETLKANEKYDDNLPFKSVRYVY